MSGWRREARCYRQPGCAHRDRDRPASASSIPLAVELASIRESRSSWRDFLVGSRRAVCTASNLSSPTIMPACGGRCARFWRRRPTSAATCIFCATRSTTCRAAHYDRLQELRWHRGPGGPARRLAEARRDTQSCRLGQRKHRRDLDVLPAAAAAGKHLKSTNMLERLNAEIRRRTHVVRIFPMARAACGWCGHWRSRPTRTGSSSSGRSARAQEGGTAPCRLTPTRSA